jgi:hypothetical protein
MAHIRAVAPKKGPMMSAISEGRAIAALKGKKWVRPLVTVVVVIVVLVLLTDGEILEPFVYTSF